MKSAPALLVPFLAFWSLFTVQGTERPNILLILADDLGYSDLGCYGAEIETPNLDALAADGLRFTRFYNTARCWPTRAALLSGYYPQQVRRDSIKGFKDRQGRGGARGKRPEWAPLAPDLLETAGYRSYHVGKWHLDGMPLASGFDRSYYLRDQGRFFNPQTHYLDDEKLPAVEKDSGFYATIELADRALEFLQHHEDQHRDSPFFTYLAFAAPHFPLQALPGDIAKYETTYHRGWQRIRTARHERMTRLGFPEVALSPVLPDLGPPYHFPDHLKILGSSEVNRPLPWHTLTDAQQEFQARKMSIHAAMIDRMDHEIGRIIRHLEKTGHLDDTLILFLSDNGASAEIMVRDDGHDPDAPMGSAATYLCLGPGWSTVANTPFRKHKTWTHEGGIATPMIVHWPDGLGRPDSQSPSPGSTRFRHTPAHVIDVLPTMLEVAGVQPTDEKVARPGKSLVPVFGTDPPDFHDHLWWSHEGHHAILRDGWKVVRSRDEPWELYHLAKDRSEVTNLANRHPEILEELVDLWTARANQFLQDAEMKEFQRGSRPVKDGPGQ